MEKLVTAADHVHDHSGDRRRRFVAPSEFHVPDFGARAAVMDQLYDAALDGCQECRSVLLDRVAADARAVSKLMEWACLIVSEVHGRFPGALLAGDEPEEAVFRTSAAFRRLAQPWAGGAQGAQAGITSADCTVPERREAADTAVALVAGLSAEDQGGREPLDIAPGEMQLRAQSGHFAEQAVIFMLQPLTMKMENADGVVEVQDAVEFLVREAGGVPLSTATLFAPERTAGWSAQLRLPGNMLLVSFPDGLCFYDGTMPTTSAWRRAVAATGDVAIITGPMTDPTCVDGAIWAGRTSYVRVPLTIHE
ncbi:hypothetical protein [Streptomyces sp. AM8-1-1]|uniref:hypothetical protein n=1 Tax=Streptomyces sp. AM8-1-1 TaxID=3075825 RepID=UPI0028C3F421|nr:hypothetical protein [Streptomyces sp. AM8-1-1]WNO76935.1 hypothetical protein RPQ07_37340 [Streptomyces sp. AM8-1-1]